MGIGFIEMLILLFTLGGGGNELLHYLPSATYWKAKGVAVSPEAMLAELAPRTAKDVAPLIPQLGAEAFDERERAARAIGEAGPAALPQLRKALESAKDAEVVERLKQLIGQLSAAGKAREVRRLMAIRTLGELKARNAEASLKDLLGSPEPFVKEYAQAALAAVLGSGPAAPAAAVPARADLALLPPGCGVAGRMVWPPGGVVDQAQLVRMLGTLPPAQGKDAEKMAEEAILQVIALTERIGNVRVDSLALGVAAEIGDRTGFVVLLARGRYDARAVKELILKEGRCEARTEDGVEVVTVEREVQLVLPSDDLLLFVGGPEPDGLPMKEVLAAVRAGGAAKPAPEVAALLEAVDASKPFWLSVRMSDTYRKLPLFAPFDTLTLASDTRAGGQDLSITAKGKDPEAVKAAVTQFEGGLKEAREAMKRNEERELPFLKTAADLLESIAVKSDGAAVTVTGRMQSGGVPVALLPFWLLMARGSPSPR
jgi:hypothetical protein